MEMPKVSIIVPVYNARETLCRCLDSLIGQTYADIEIILVNDGSSDNSQQICESYRDKCSKIRLINQENAGPATARNTGIDNARGKYLSFVDADDHVESNMIEEMVKVAEDNCAEMVICGYYQEFSETIKKHEFSYTPGLYTGDAATKIATDLISDVSDTRIPPYSWVRMVLKASLDQPKIRYAAGMVRSEDYYFFVQFHFRIDRLYLLTDKPLYHYMEVDSSVTHRYVPEYWNSVKEIYWGLADKLPQKEEIKKRLDVMLVQRSLIALNNSTRCNDKDTFRNEIYEIAGDSDLKAVICRMGKSEGFKNFRAYYLLMRMHMSFLVYWRFLLKYYRKMK